MDKLDRLLDRLTPVSRRRSSEDPVRTLKVDKGSDFRHRYNHGSHVPSGYGSFASGGRRAESVAWETPRGRGISRVPFEVSSEEDRSMIREKASLSKTDRTAAHGWVDGCRLLGAQTYRPKAPWQVSAAPELFSMRG